MKKHFNNDIKQRLSVVSQALNISLPALAQQIDVPYSSLHKWATGNAKPNVRLYEGLYALGVDINWFISGEGQVLRNARSDNQSAESIENEISIVSWVKEYWETAEPDERIWLDVEMRRCFKDYSQFKASIKS